MNASIHGFSKLPRLPDNGRFRLENIQFVIKLTVDFSRSEIKLGLGKCLCNALKKGGSGVQVSPPFLFLRGCDCVIMDFSQ